MSTKRKPIITTDRRKVQAYNDSLKYHNTYVRLKDKVFKVKVKKLSDLSALTREVNENNPPWYINSRGKQEWGKHELYSQKGKGDEGHKVGLTNYKKPEQPYIYKKVEEEKKKEKKKIKKIKKDIVPVPVKESIPKDTIPVVKPIIEPVVKPQVEKEPEPIVPKKLPGGSGPFARYPNMKGQLSNVKTSRMVNGRNVNNITVTGPKYQNGTKKLSYKDWKNSLPDNLRTESKLYNLRGAYEGGLEPELNEDGFYHLGSRNPKTGEILKSPAHNTFKEAINADRKLGYIPLVKPDGKVYTQNPEEQTFVSGAKSVKQYRGDENLPEAKNGMKKGCGCKHSKSKYKYQDGTDDLSLEVDNDPEIIELNRKLKEVNDRVFGKTAKPPVAKPAPVVAKKPVTKIQTPVVAKTKIAVPVTKTVKNVQKTVVKPVQKKIIEKPKSITSYKRPSKLEALHSYKNFDSQVDSLENVSNLSQAKKRYEIASVNTNKQKFLQSLPQKEQDFINTYYRTQTRQQDMKEAINENIAYQKKLLNKNKQRFKKSEDVRKYEAAVEEKELNPSFFDSVKYAFKNKYKYGTGALTIPEGSAIVTANKGKNKQALMAYKKGNYKLLNNIIDDMPEDNVDKAQAGKKKVLTREEREARYKRARLLTGPLSPEEEADFKEDEKVLQEDTFTPYTSPVEDAWEGEDEDNKKHRERLQTDPAFRAAEMKAGRAYKDKKGNFNYKYAGNSYKKNQPNNDEIAGKFTSNKLPDIKISDEDAKALKTPPPGNTSNNNSQDEKKNSNKRRGFDIPSLAEVAARGSILSQGVEGVPENYLKLGRYNYASQLDRTLRENAIAANTAKENIRDVSGGSAGSYLSNVANITAKRFDANAAAVGDDTLERQKILNLNVDKGDEEAKVNTGLRNQYAQQRSANRGAYNNQLIALGQGIDTAVDASKLMSSQRDNDDVRTNLLKSGNYYMDKDGNVHMNKAKGSKKLKTYKRK